jgi:hypothetical protein
MTDAKWWQKLILSLARWANKNESGTRRHNFFPNDFFQLSMFSNWCEYHEDVIVEKTVKKWLKMDVNIHISYFLYSYKYIIYVSTLIWSNSIINIIYHRTKQNISKPAGSTVYMICKITYSSWLATSLINKTQYKLINQ